jgi:hypothetical protein
MRGLEGPSGFTLLLEVDHGAWMARFGLKARGKHFIVGNPLIGRADIRARYQSRNERPRGDIHKLTPARLAKESVMRYYRAALWALLCHTRQNYLAFFAWIQRTSNSSPNCRTAKSRTTL